MCVLWFQKLPAQNPILKNITDYLIEEVSAEEEELLGSGSGVDPEESAKEGNPAETTVERDDKLAKVQLGVLHATQFPVKTIHYISSVYSLPSFESRYDLSHCLSFRWLT